MNTKQKSAASQKIDQPKNKHPELGEDSSESSFNRLNPLNTHNIVALQSVIGNAAVQRLIKHRSNPPAISQNVNATQPNIQRLMSLREFQKATGQIKKKGGTKRFSSQSEKIDTDNFSGVAGTATLNETRMEYGISETRTTANINRAFNQYEQAPTLHNLILLYDMITYFETLYAGQALVATAEPILNQLKSQIKSEIESRMKSSDPDTKTPEDNKKKKTKVKAKELIKGYPQTRPSADPKKTEATAMPFFLKDVGISPDYYQKNLAGNAEHLKNLEDLYTQLKNGHLYNATKAFQKVQDLPGINSLRSLFLSRFPQQANMTGLVGTESPEQEKESSQLTPEEIQAIKIYSGASAYSLNTQLRQHDMRRKGGPMVGKARLDNDVKEVERRVKGGPLIGKRKMRKVETEKIEAATRNRSIMETAIKGLNKLPQYSGIAYRIVKDPPASLLPSLSPGGITSDLAFNSASPTMQGVFNYSTPTPKSIYYLVHTKQAANIVAISSLALEGEILFKPGTRFAVNHLWEPIGNKLPDNAPTEAKMMFVRIMKKLDQDNSLRDNPVASNIKIVEVSEV